MHLLNRLRPVSIPGAQLGSLLAAKRGSHRPAWEFLAKFCSPDVLAYRSSRPLRGCIGPYDGDRVPNIKIHRRQADDLTLATSRYVTLVPRLKLSSE